MAARVPRSRSACPTVARRSSPGTCSPTPSRTTSCRSRRPKALDALAERLSTLDDWLPPDAWVDGNGSAPSVAFEAPDDILPPASIVVVSVDTLQIRAEPGLAAAVVGTASEGDRFYVLYVFGPVVADGLAWYRLTTAGDSVLWAAAGSGDDRYLEIVPPDCPAADPDLATLTDMLNDWDRLACFGDRQLTIEGTYGCPGGCGGTTAGDFDPGWLAFPTTFHFLWVDHPADPRSLELHFSPDFSVPPAEGSIVRVTGHFSDPASTTCTMSTFDGEQAIAVDPRTAELYCREQFVVDAFEVIGSDPDFP